jgi:hypothetical protein
MKTEIIARQIGSSTQQSSDLPKQLAELMILGWTESQIIRLAQMRGKYSDSFDDDTLALSRQTVAQQNRLSFARWLYQNGRLKG